MTFSHIPQHESAHWPKYRYLTTEWGAYRCRTEVLLTKSYKNLQGLFENTLKQFYILELGQEYSQIFTLHFKLQPLTAFGSRSHNALTRNQGVIDHNFAFGKRIQSPLHATRKMTLRVVFCFSCCCASLSLNQAINRSVGASDPSHWVVQQCKKTELS